MITFNRLINRLLRRRPVNVQSITASLDIMAAQLGEHQAAQQNVIANADIEIARLEATANAADAEMTRAATVQARLLAILA